MENLLKITPSQNTLSRLARIVNLLYRRSAIGTPPDAPITLEFRTTTFSSRPPQVTNLPYGRLKIGATFWIGLLLFWCSLTSASEAEVDSGAPPPNLKHSKKIKPAQLKISGYGFLGDRVLRNLVRVLVLNGKKPEFFDANFVEDAALILSSTLRRDGYLEPAVTAEITLEGGGQLAYKWNEAMPASLPHMLHVSKIHFKLHKGVLYYYQAVQFQGLKNLAEKKARALFIESGLLLRLRSSRVYTPEKLRRALSSLTDLLERQGYETARATAQHLTRDDKTGAVTVNIQVEEGRKSMVRSVREEFFATGGGPEVRSVFPHQPYSRLWEQDFTQALKTNYYHRGYPDTGVEVKRLKEELQGDLLQLDLLMSIRTGNKIQLGKVKFEEEKKAKVSLLQGRVRLQEGSLLDRIKVEQGRYRLAQLGIFESVDLRYEPQDEHTRDVIYRVKETKTTELSLLFGFGSYELLRGGVELERRDLFGLAHDARLKLVQSFKASSGEFYYTVPELVGRDVDLFVNGTALRRQEVSFLREEYGGGAGAHKFYKDLASDLSVRYNYQILNAAQVDGIIATEGVRNPTVGAIVADLKHDRRDNPLYPHSGYRIFLTVESATQYLGGDVNYERADLSTSYHQPLGGGRWLHFGLSHGVAYALGSSSNNLPFTRRFFPGGQNSIRGYEEGRASSRDEQGRFVGAATYALGSVEFEQALTPKWSLVLFSDSLGEARRIEHYPFDTGLFSIGLGLSWRTIIGPVRLEYGHNLNPRQGDPSGTVQFSFGFPF